MTPLVDKACKKTEWFTPLHVVEEVRRYFWFDNHGVVDLDPATAPSNPVGAGNFFTDMGLSRPWKVKGRDVPNVFVNPPYGKELPRWIEKIGLEMGHAHVVALLPSNRFETRYWQEFLAPRLAWICFVRGRLKFDHPEDRALGLRTRESGNPFGSVLVCNRSPTDHAALSLAISRLGYVFEVKP